MIAPTCGRIGTAGGLPAFAKECATLERIGVHRESFAEPLLRL